MDDSDMTYQVVVNDEEQYSIWPVDRELPPGWRAEGKLGSKQECLGHIDEVWTDMRPLSLRRFMEEQAALAPAAEPDAVADEDEAEPLPVRLSRADTRVEAVVYPEATAQALREAIDRGFVIVRFVETDGGTELGVDLEPGSCDLSAADFDAPTGTVHLEGTLTLDYVPVRCRATIDLADLSGHGRLEIVEPV